MFTWENCSVLPSVKEGAEPPSHGQALLEQLTQYSFHLFPKPKRTEGKGEAFAPWDPRLFPLLELPESSILTSPLLLLFPGFSQEFLKFATIEAIQRTEIFEYCQMLGRPKSFIPSFQVTEPGGDLQFSCGQPGFQLCCLAPGTLG